MIGRWGRGLGIALAGWLLAAAASALAASGGNISLPAGPKPTVNGLALTLDSDWAEGRGYRPVRIDITCTPPAAGDRTIDIELSAAVWPSRPYVTVETEIEIPAGSTRASKILSVPELSTMQYFTLDVWEDGAHLDGLSAKNWSAGAVRGGWNSAEVPAILFVTAKPLNLASLSFLTSDPFGPGYQVNQAISNASQLGTFVERPPGGLVENWINYTNLDVIVLSLTDAEGLAATRPKVWQALADSTRAGGNLCVYGVGDDWHGLQRVDALLGSEAVAPKDAGPKYGWSDPDPQNWNRNFFQGSVPSAFQMLPANADDAPDDGTDAAGRRRRRSSARRRGRRSRAARAGRQPPCPDPSARCARHKAEAPPRDSGAQHSVVRLERRAVRPRRGDGQRQALRAVEVRVAMGVQHDLACPLEMAVSSRPVARLRQPELR